MNVTVLASGSAGNATLFSSDDASVLVDAGIGPRVLARMLGDLALPSPDAIVITHAHGDHVGQCERIAQKYGIPIYRSEATARAVPLGAHTLARRYGSRDPFAVGPFTLSPLPLPHDAAQVALVVEAAGQRAAIVTDLGEVTASLPDHLAACDVVLLEANHDADLLRDGPYAAFLKQRIASSRGHLSNDQTAALLRTLSPATHTVVLMHLSRTNNTPALALAAARDALGERPVMVTVAPPRGPATFATTAPHRLASPHPRPVNAWPAGMRQGSLPFV